MPFSSRITAGYLQRLGGVPFQALVPLPCGCRDPDGMARKGTGPDGTDSATTRMFLRSISRSTVNQSTSWDRRRGFESRPRRKVFLRKLRRPRIRSSGSRSSCRWTERRLFASFAPLAPRVCVEGKHTVGSSPHFFGPTGRAVVGRCSTSVKLSAKQVDDLHLFASTPNQSLATTDSAHLVHKCWDP